MALFISLSIYVAAILLLVAVGPLWAWIVCWRKRLDRKRRMNALRKRQILPITHE